MRWSCFPGFTRQDKTRNFEYVFIFMLPRLGGSRLLPHLGDTKLLFALRSGNLGQQIFELHIERTDPLSVILKCLFHSSKKWWPWENGELRDFAAFPTKGISMGPTRLKMVVFIGWKFGPIEIPLVRVAAKSLSAPFSQGYSLFELKLFFLMLAKNLNFILNLIELLYLGIQFCITGFRFIKNFG